jgi:hypothetical protein
MVNAPLRCPFPELESPNSVIVLEEQGTGKHVHFNFEGTVGLAAFTSIITAANFMQVIHIEGSLTVQNCLQMPFNSALDLAKSKPAPCVCLWLADDPGNPIPYYIR